MIKRNEQIVVSRLQSNNNGDETADQNRSLQINRQHQDTPTPAIKNIKKD